MLKIKNTEKKLLSTIKLSICIISIIAVVAAVIMISISILSKGNYTPDIGSLLGGALGGIGTLIAIMLTIKDNATRDTQNKIDSVRPYLKVSHINGGDNNDTFETEFDLIVEDDVIYQKVNFDMHIFDYVLCFKIKNMGLGSAVNVSIQIKHNGIEAKTKNYFSLEKSSCVKRNLSFNFDNMEGEYELTLFFYDLYGTSYTQSYSFELVKHEYKDEVEVEYFPYILKDYIEEKVYPTIIKLPEGGDQNGQNK